MSGTLPGPGVADPGAGAACPAPVVVYIAGSGRSGSTLLERVIGAVPGAVNVGELMDLFRRTAPLGERCGCGEPFVSCPFWAGVGKRAFGGWDSAQLAEVSRLQHRVSRQRHLPRLVALPMAAPAFRREVASYGGYYARLYQAIAAEAGAGYVVDASKWPVQALVLARAGIDVRVIHLVRDSRGVAHSHGKRDIARPHAVAETDVMWHNAPAIAAARWTACQSEAELLRSCGLRVTRMRYEEFVAAPRRAVASALTSLGLPPGPSGLAHIGERTVMLGASHGLSGNPSRFRLGEVSLRADEAWRGQMSRRDRILVTAISLPLLVRYGRPGGGRGGRA